jgi:hypothetical protein
MSHVRRFDHVGLTVADLDELGLGIGGQRGEAQKVSYVDTGQRPIDILGHAAILSPKLPD